MPKGGGGGGDSLCSFHSRLSRSYPDRRTLFDHLYYFKSTKKKELFTIKNNNLTYSLLLFLEKVLAIATFGNI